MGRDGKNKRQWRSQKGNQRGGGRDAKSRRNNPKRGGPGVLLTCEAGRELKCQREGMDILRHYHYTSQSKGGNDGKEDKADATSEGVEKDEIQSDKNDLSLEEEIEMLKRGASADTVLHDKNRGKGDGKILPPAPFKAYETACRGTVFIMCTLPNCNLIPAIADSNEKEAGCTATSEKKEEENGGETAKKRVQEEETERGPKKQKVNNHFSDTKGEGNNSKLNLDEDRVQEMTPWDPMSTVQQVINNIRENSSPDAPRSRFITRMVPIQATCFASITEITQTAALVIEKFLLPARLQGFKEKRKVLTFKVDFRRRICSNVTRDEVIDAVANLVDKLSKSGGSDEGIDDKKDPNSCDSTDNLPPFAVELSNPDFTILIEICRTLCGMSVVANAKSYRNFNFIEIQQEADSHKS